jgi:hypothetical protein
MSLQIRIRTQIQSIKRSIHAIKGRNIFSPSAASISALYCPVFTSYKHASTSEIGLFLDHGLTSSKILLGSRKAFLPEFWFPPPSLSDEEISIPSFHVQTAWDH